MLIATTKPLRHVYVIEYMDGNYPTNYFTYDAAEYRQALIYLGALYFIRDYYRHDYYCQCRNVPRLEDVLIDKNDIKFMREDVEDFIHYFEYYLENLDK